MSTSQREAPRQGDSQNVTDDGESRVSGDTAQSEGALSEPGRKRRLLSEAQEAEVREQRETLRETRRVTAPGLEEILYEPLPVLDHGFVRVIDYMGDDGAIVQAARVSYGKGTKHLRGDTGLINYLLRHRHTTPFEMCEIKYHVKLPIFVAPQWIRHRTANVNVYSARHSILDNEFYTPVPAHLAAHFFDITADAVVRTITFAANFFVTTQDRLASTDVDNDVAVFFALDDTVDDGPGAILKLLELPIALCLANFLQYHLFSRLRSDPPHFNRRDFFAEYIADTWVIQILLGLFNRKF